MSESVKSSRLAVLIDADNASRKDMRAIIDEIAQYGTPTVKRAYGDWAKSTLSGWKETLLEIGAVAVQQYAYTEGKNATDSAMIIDAMDFLHAGRIDGFVLVSSDSDFTPLALRLRESGMRVYGVGEKKTPSPFIKACDKFTYVEILRKPTDSKSSDTAHKAHLPSAATVRILVESIAELADESGFCNLSQLRSLVVKKRPDFDHRKYGYSQLSKLLRAIPRFEVRSIDNGQPLVRDKQAK